MESVFYGLKKQNIMNTQKLEIAIDQLKRVHRDMNDCANRFILKDAIDQLQEVVKLFAIPRVSKRFSFADFAIGLIAGILGTIVAIAYIL